MTAQITAEAGPVSFLAMTINASASITAAFDLPGKIVALEIPAAARGAKYFFQGSSTAGGTFARVGNDANSSVSVVATTRTAQYKSLEPAKTFGVRFFKVESNSIAGATVQLQVGYVR